MRVVNSRSSEQQELDVDHADQTSESEQVSSATLLADIVNAAGTVAEAKARRDGDGLAAGKCKLYALVRAARDRSVSWQTIGDALGVRRGAAYQRFRHPVMDTTSTRRLASPAAGGFHPGLLDGVVPAVDGVE